MTLTEKKRDIVHAIESAIGGKYASIPFHAPYMEDDYNERWFKVADDRYAHVDTIDGDIVIEYCEDLEHRFLAEDGDIFSIEDYNGLDEIIQAIFSELIS